MEYRKLGNTDLEVSALCLGTMTFGEQNSYEDAGEQLAYALDQDVNFIDAAEMYPVPPKPDTQGDTERLVGRWLKETGRRKDVIVATKVTGHIPKGGDFDHIRGGPRLSRQHILEAVEGSLERLQTDYIDLYQLHWPDRTTNFFGPLGYRHYERESVPIEESLAALGEIVATGKVRAVGISNESPWGMAEYLRLAREQNLPRVVSIQNPYSLLNRSFEIGLAEFAIREKVGLLAYSPMAFGLLSGKYAKGVRPEGSRLALFKRFSRYSNPQAQAAADAYTELAREADLDPAQMALAFVTQQQFTTSTIIGATTMDQLRSNVGSIDVKLDRELVEKIDEIHARYTIPAP